MRNIKNNNIGAGGLLACLALNPCVVMSIIFIIFLVVVLIVAAVISLTWGMFGLIGFAFLCAAAFIMLMNKGKISMNLASPFVWCAIIGVIMMLISAAGFEIITLNLSGVPGSGISMNLFGSNYCPTC